MEVAVQICPSSLTGIKPWRGCRAPSAPADFRALCSCSTAEHKHGMPAAPGAVLHSTWPPLQGPAGRRLQDKGQCCLSAVSELRSWTCWCHAWENPLLSRSPQAGHDHTYCWQVQPEELKFTLKEKKKTFPILLIQYLK